MIYALEEILWAFGDECTVSLEERAAKQSEFFIEKVKASFTGWRKRSIRLVLGGLFPINTPNKKRLNNSPRSDCNSAALHVQPSYPEHYTHF
jgi:hypothetical protein